MTENAQNPSLFYFPCPSGWFHFGADCYGYNIEELTWSEAEVECQLMDYGAHLVSILSAREADFIGAMLRAKEKRSISVWIGLHDPIENHHWKWSDSGIPNYQAWASVADIPDQCEKKLCAALLPKAGRRFTLWEPFPCDDRKPFVCKFES
ncbi:regenerating islet-derived protein 4-like isoform X2 [Protopterus annectens]|nr:regenerating islet-derived protein 4-like isoform X2 [Protopterus annectens]